MSALANQNVRANANEDSAYFLRNSNPLIIKNLVATSVNTDVFLANHGVISTIEVSDQLELNTGLISYSTGTMQLLVNGNPVSGTSGATGPVGPVGPIGPIGPPGPQGEKGSTGDKGPTGDKGATGERGPTGAKGDTGVIGPAGLGGTQVVWGSFISTSDQILSSAGKNLTYDTATGFQTSYSGSEITVNIAGNYSIMFSAQLIGGANEELKLWLRLNGADVANSASTKAVKNGENVVMTVEFIETLAAGTKIEIMGSSPSNLSSVNYISASGPAPANPSLITTVKLINYQGQTGPTGAPGTGGDITQWATKPAVQDVDMGNYELKNVDAIGGGTTLTPLTIQGLGPLSLLSGSGILMGSASMLGGINIYTTGSINLESFGDITRVEDVQFSNNIITAYNPSNPLTIEGMQVINNNILAANALNPITIEEIQITSNAIRGIPTLNPIQIQDVYQINNTYTNELDVNVPMEIRMNSAKTRVVGELHPDKLLDTAGFAGTPGQVLYALGSGSTEWQTLPFPNIPGGGGQGDILVYNGSAYAVESTILGIGRNAGQSNQFENSIAIGTNAGQDGLSTNSIAIGVQAGQYASYQNTISIGNQAGWSTQRFSAIAIGFNAGMSNQQNEAVAIGQGCGRFNQQNQAVAIGNGAGQTTQGSSSVAIGRVSGQTNQQGNCVAIGNSAGQSGQIGGAIGIGTAAGGTTQGGTAVAIGDFAGNANQQTSAIAIGRDAGRTTQGTQSVAIGSNAGAFTQGTTSVAVGPQCGQSNQLANAVAIGVLCGHSNQGPYGIAIGRNSGQSNQRQGGISLGFFAGRTNQGTVAGSNAIAIGEGAGETDQGSGAIAIGYRTGRISQAANSIGLNATNTEMPVNAAGFFVNPIRQSTIGAARTMWYDDVRREVFYDSAKTFVIDHPTDAARHLVHACLEGPEAGVYYRGQAIIPGTHEHVEVQLPDYVKHIAYDLQVQATPVADQKYIKQVNVSEVDENGRFRIIGDAGKVNWVVYGKRHDIRVEPLRSDVAVRGDGPYKYL
jgi:hypothetical protein